MKKVINIVVAVGAVVAVWLLVRGITTVAFEQMTPTQTSKIPSQMSKQEYLEIAVPNCTQDGLTANQCRCFYSEMIDNYGVTGTWRFDIDALRSDYQAPDEVITIVSECI